MIGIWENPVFKCQGQASPNIDLGFFVELETTYNLRKLYLQQDPVGHYQLGQKNTVYLEMIYLGVQCMYFRAKPLQNQCILGLVHYTK